MTDRDAGPDSRAERLAAALRDNLRKRKAQARGDAGAGAGQTKRPEDARDD